MVSFNDNPGTKERGSLVAALNLMCLSDISGNMVLLGHLHMRTTNGLAYCNPYI